MQVIEPQLFHRYSLGRPIEVVYMERTLLMAGGCSADTSWTKGDLLRVGGRISFGEGLMTGIRAIAGKAEEDTHS